MNKDLQDFRDEIAKEFANENAHFQVGALKEALAWARWEQTLERVNNDTPSKLKWRNSK